MATLHLFNPWNEMAIADGGNGFIPNNAIRQMENDIAPLLWLFADPDDVVVVRDLPDNWWLIFLGKITPETPRFLTFEQALQELKQKRLTIEKIEPWGWSPRTLKLIEPFFPFLPASEMEKPMYRWDVSYKEIYGRQIALTINQTFLNQIQHRNLFIDDENLPQKIANIAELESLVDRWKQVVIKAPHSSSGRGILTVRKNGINRNIIQCTQHAIEKSGYAMVEPKFYIIAELSTQFTIDKNRCTPLSIQAFRCDENGNYQGNFVLKMPVSEELTTFIEQIDLSNLSKKLAIAVDSIGLSSYYHGYLGIDMLIYRNHKGQLKINPCSEINIRKNMGVVAHFAGGLIPENHYGFFRIINRKNPNHSNLFSRLETHKNDDTIRKILPLTPYKQRQYCAIVEILPTPQNQPILQLGKLV